MNLALLAGRGRTDWFQDTEFSPQMVVVPSGTFVMGAASSEAKLDPYWSQHNLDEWPVRNITIARPFAVGRFAVTVAEFEAYVTSARFKTQHGAHTFEDGRWLFRKERSWLNPGFKQSQDEPVVCISWNEAVLYVTWLSRQTGHTYRLLTEAEWEYVCRAGTTTPFWWGSGISAAQCNYDCSYVYDGSPIGPSLNRTTPVGSYEPNPWGLYQTHGNVAEWCEDNWSLTAYDPAPLWKDGPPGHGSRTDASPYIGHIGYRRVVRGGSWRNSPGRLRSSCRNRANAGRHNSSIGFRVARTLDD